MAPVHWAVHRVVQEQGTVERLSPICPSQTPNPTNLWVRGIIMGKQICAPTSAFACSSPIHSTYYCHCSLPRRTEEKRKKGAPVKLRCERDLLLDALTTASKATSSRGGSLPVLSGVRLELDGNRCTCTGSDLDLTITTTTEVSGSEDGVVVLPARLAVEIARSLPAGAVALHTDDTEAHIEAGRSQFSVRLIPADDFPKLASASGEAMVLPADELAEALRQVVPAASTDDARPVLTGVLMAAEASALRLVATDSYRLSVRDLPERAGLLGAGQRVLVPSRALGELRAVLDSGGEVEVRLGEHDASFTIAGVELTTRLLGGEFPDYRSLIPSGHPNRLEVDRSELYEAVRRVRIMAKDATPVRLVQHPDSLELVAVSQDLGQATEEIDATYEGEELTVAFNPGYLLDGIEVIAGDRVVIESVDALKPALVRPVDDSDFIYLLMPVRVS